MISLSKALTSKKDGSLSSDLMEDFPVFKSNYAVDLP